MTIERQTKKLYDLINQTETVPVGCENLTIFRRGPECQMVIRVMKVLSANKQEINAADLPGRLFGVEQLLWKP